MNSDLRNPNISLPKLSVLDSEMAYGALVSPAVAAEIRPQAQGLPTDQARGRRAFSARGSPGDDWPIGRGLHRRDQGAQRQNRSVTMAAPFLNQPGAIPSREPSNFQIFGGKHAKR
jgi:hypothetical protein